VPSPLRRFRLAALLAPLAAGLLFAPLALADDTFTLVNDSSTATLQNRWGPPVNQDMPPCTSGAFLNGNPYKFGPGAQGSITLSRSPFSSCDSSMQEIQGGYANYGDGGRWTWAPDDPTTGPASLTSCSVSSSIGGGIETLQASVNQNTLTCTITDTAPTCSNGNATTPFNTQVTVTLDCVAAITKYNVANAPDHGSLGAISSSNGQVTYTPNPGYQGPDSFTFDATGPGGTSNTATTTISVGPAPPTCSNGSATTRQNTPVTIALGCSGQITDYSVVNGPDDGSLGSISSSGQVTYTPNSNFSGSDSFTFNASGPGGTSSTVTMSVSVNANPPTCSNGTATTPQNQAVTIALGCSGEITGFNVVNGPDSGTLGQISGSGQVTYTPNSNFSGSDSFTFTASGPGGTSTPPARISVAVNANPPTCSNGTATTPQNQSVTIALGCSGEITSLQIVSGPSKGTLGQISPTGQVTYTPNAGYDGSDSFTFNATGPGGTSNTATIAITDTPADLPPVCQDNSVVVSGGEPKSIALGCSGEVSSLQIVSQPTEGTLSAISGGQVTYTPDPGYDGSDSFTFNATGPGGTSNTATIAISDTPDDLPPVCPNHSDAISFDTPTKINLGCSGEITTRVILTRPRHGTLIVHPSSNSGMAGDATAATYRPDPGFTGADSFKYAAAGPGGFSKPAKVTLAVARPTVAKLRLAPDRFAAASQGTPLGPPLPKSKASSVPRGSKIKLKLDSAALVHFFVRRRGAPSPSTPRRRHGFNRHLKAGNDSFRFTGKLYGKPLRAGRYHLYARVVSPSGRRFKRVSAPFTIVAR
jgi:hypothetical protein